MNPPAKRQTPGEEAVYNIGVVNRMTGISVVTLRAWSRRYGFPELTRTAGGHRLYSEKDVLRLRWVKGQIDKGMQTAQAIRALRLHEEEGRSLKELLQPAGFEQFAGEQRNLVVFRQRLEQALMRHDTEEADRALGEALLLYALDDLIFEVIQPTLAEIGCAWEDKRISVATEHLMTNYLRHRLVAWMLSGPTPYQVRPVALACAPGEWHEGSLLILGALLRCRRWPVAYLGQSVPLPDLADFVRETRSPVVVLVAMTEEPAVALMEWPRWLPEALETGRPVIAYGGRAFNPSGEGDGDRDEGAEWRGRIPGTFLGGTLPQGLQRLEALLQELRSAAPDFDQQVT